MGDSLHNLPDLHSTLQHTTKLHTTLWLDGVLQGCVRHLCGWASTQPDLHTTLQRTTELYITLQLGGVLQGCMCQLDGWPSAQPNSPAHNLGALQWPTSRRVACSSVVCCRVVCSLVRLCKGCNPCTCVEEWCEMHMYILFIFLGKNSAQNYCDFDA